MAVTRRHLQEAVEIARNYGATRLLLFGSALTNPESARDLDLAVDGVPGWDLFRMAADMEERLRIPLDVVPLDVDDPFIRFIEKSGRVLYERE